MGFPQAPSRNLVKSLVVLPLISLPFYRLRFPARHLFGVEVIAFFLDHGDGSRSIRSEYERKELGNDVVEFFALFGRSMDLAFGTAQMPLFDAAFSDLAPSGFFVLVAAGAFAVSMSLAGAAIKPAIADQVFIGYYLFHTRWDNFDFCKSKLILNN